jgi:hypothetical protein
MKSFSLNQIGVIKMCTNPPEEIVNAGMCVISNADNHIYLFDNMKWNKTRKADRKDYQNIPQLI